MTSKSQSSKFSHSHTPSAIRERLEAGFKHSYLKDFIYGAIDGTVTTFAVVSGVVGANLSSKVIIILGLSNLIADGFSMAISNYIGTKAEHQLLDHIRESEKRHIEKFPEGEKEEIRQIFEAKGFKGADLERVVKVITSDSERWIDTMIQEEFGMSLNPPSPVKAGLATFAAFMLIGFVPLYIFVYEMIFQVQTPHPFMISSVMTGLAFFIVGAMKGKFVGQRWWLSGLETFSIGAMAAGLAYSVGALLEAII